MTVSANSRRREYQGNGVTQTFNGPMAFVPSDVKVYIQDASGEYEISPGSFSIDRFGRLDGTRVFLNTAPATGQKIVILRVVPYTQETDITNQGAFLPEVIEQALDVLVMQIQQLADLQNRTLRYPDSANISGLDLYLPLAEPGKAIGWNADGSGLRNILLQGAGDLTLRNDLGDPTAGSNLVSFKRGNTGAVARTVLSKLLDTVSVFDFMTASQRSDVLAGTLSMDVTASVQAAINTGAVVEFPAGKYRITAPITLSAGGGIQGDGERTQFFRAFTGGTMIRHPGGNQFGDPIILRDFAIDKISTLTVASTDTGIEIGYAAPWAQRGDISNIVILRQWDGFKWTGGTMGNISSVQVLEGKGRGFVGINARGELNSCLSQFNASHGYFIYAQTVGETGIQFTSCGTFANGGWGYLFDGAVNGANIYMKGVSSSTDAAGGIGFARKFEQIWMTQILIESAGDANFQRPEFPLVNTAIGLYMVGGCEKLVASDIFVQTSRGAGCFFDALTRSSLTNMVCIDSGRGGLGGANAVGVNFNSNCSDVKMFGLIANFGGFQTTDISMSGTTNSVDFFGASFRTYATGGGKEARFHGPRTTASAAVNAASTTTLVDYADFIAINGTTNINAITASWPGRRVTLMFTGTLSVADGNNLKLNAVFSATPDDTLSLVCDGTNWFETARSAN